MRVAAVNRLVPSVIPDSGFDGEVVIVALLLPGTSAAGNNADVSIVEIAFAVAVFVAVSVAVAVAVVVVVAVAVVVVVAVAVVVVVAVAVAVAVAVPVVFAFTAVGVVGGVVVARTLR
eukprot:TRINITY_DN7348_c0_g1_i1.p2 TRINITY_DN7348_c0_g1~~TRINITY_DN7348_c0_g1_i1.p2  ORF type:complete len:118 (+),score=37.16 TRINITY_DN7348_c0_g1_i1:242-595(+)